MLVKAIPYKLLTDIRGYLAGSDRFLLRDNALATGAYPIDLEFTLKEENRYYSPKDDHGIPMRRYLSVGRQYNPTRVAAYGLAHYNRYVESRSERELAVFLKTADWFANFPDAQWRYEFDWGALRAPWISAMAQGEGMSVLVRAWRVTQNELYLQRAMQAARVFQRHVNDGGVLSFLDDGTPFLEEYPTAKPAHVLNGFLYSLIGIIDMQHIANEMPVSVAFFNDLFSGLEKHITDWDLGYWSAYDLFAGRFDMRNPATANYHNLHITQLEFIEQWRSSEAIAATVNRWKRYKNRTVYRLRAMTGKILFRTMQKAQR